MTKPNLGDCALFVLKSNLGRIQKRDFASALCERIPGWPNSDILKIYNAVKISKWRLRLRPTLCNKLRRDIMIIARDRLDRRGYWSARPSWWLGR